MRRLLKRLRNGERFFWTFEYQHGPVAPALFIGIVCISWFRERCSEHNSRHFSVALNLD